MNSCQCDGLSHVGWILVMTNGIYYDAYGTVCLRMFTMNAFENFAYYMEKQ